MFKSILASILFFFVVYAQALSQSATVPAQPNFVYHPPSEDKQSWQRLNLLMSATYYRVVKEGEVDFDSCLLYCSRSLGLSRLPLLAEGIDDPTLFSQSQWIDQRDPGKGARLLSQATGKKRLEILLLLGAYYAFEPRTNYQTDSVEYFLFKVINEVDNSKDIRVKRQALCLLGKMYVQTNESAKGDSVFNELIAECKTAGDKETEARAYDYWASYPEYNPATIPKRITNFQKAADLYHDLNNTEAELNVFTDMGYLLVTTNQLQKAHDAFLKAFQLTEAINYPYTHYNTDALAMITMFEGKFGEPLKYTFETIKTAEATHDSIGWAHFYGRLGMLHKMGELSPEEALKWELKSVNRFIIDGDAAISFSLHNITNTMVHFERSQEALDLVSRISKKIIPRHPQDQINYNLAFANCYRGLKQYNLAEVHLKQADRIQNQSTSLRSATQKATITLSFGEVYFSAGQLERSKEYIELYLTYPFRDKNMHNEIVAYSKLAYIDSALKKYSSSVNRYRMYVRLLDSNFRVSKIRQAEELQVMYGTKEKEDEIIVLNQQAKIEQANLKQSTLIKNVTIGGIIAVLIITGLLYRQSRLRKKNNIVITHKNEQLQHFLTEKEWLLKEIHHRVKNNLQIVMSLLNSQSAYIDNEPALTAIHDSQHRVHAMALIHQKLYGSENVSSIDISFYIRELVSYLADSFNTGQRIRFEYDIEPLDMDVSQAVPLGLILNEAITNAIKYAFPDGRNGVLSISLKKTDIHRYLLSISDNGIGMPPSVRNKKTSSLGMSLMAGLSEDLDGSFAIENNNGTTINISFTHDPGIKRHDAAISSVALFN